VGLRLTRRGRLVLAIAALLALVAFGALGARVVPARSAIPPSAPSVVQVQPGDTLWSIARRVAPDADTRAVVDAIAARNGLVGGALHPGQRLLIRP
jgi:LysM repeat protein